MQPPRTLSTYLLRLSPLSHQQWDAIAKRLQTISGMVEVTLIGEENMAYLKMERETLKHPDFIRLKEELQSQS